MRRKKGSNIIILLYFNRIYIDLSFFCYYVRKDRFPMLFLKPKPVSDTLTDLRWTFRIFRFHFNTREKHHFSIRAGVIYAVLSLPLTSVDFPPQVNNHFYSIQYEEKNKRLVMSESLCETGLGFFTVNFPPFRILLLETIYILWSGVYSFN